MGGVENFQDVATASYFDLSNAELIYMQWMFSQAFGGIYLREVFGICVYKYWLYYFVLFLHKTLRGFINSGCFILSFCGIIKLVSVLAHHLPKGCWYL